MNQRSVFVVFRHSSYQIRFLLRNLCWVGKKLSMKSSGMPLIIASLYVTWRILILQEFTQVQYTCITLVMTSMHTTLIRRASGDYINFCSIEQLRILLHLLIGILVQCRLSLHLTIFSLTICWYLPILSGGQRSIIKY